MAAASYAQLSPERQAAYGSEETVKGKDHDPFPTIQARRRILTKSAPWDSHVLASAGKPQDPRRDPNLHKFLDYYYRDDFKDLGCGLLEFWGHPFPLVGWPINIDWGGDVNTVLFPWENGKKIERGEATTEFAFYCETLVDEKVKLANDGRITFDNNQTFCLRHFNPVGPAGPTVVSGLIGRYYDRVATCDALQEELTSAWKKDRPNANKFGAFAVGLASRRKATEWCRERGVSPITDGSGRSGAIAVSTLTVFRSRVDEYQAFILRRSSRVVPRTQSADKSDAVQTLRAGLRLVSNLAPQRYFVPDGTRPVSPDGSHR